MQSVKTDPDRLERDSVDESNVYRSIRRSKRNELGAIPAVKDPERRQRCRNNFQLWCKTYMPKVFFRPFRKQLHGKIAKLMEIRGLKGGKLAISAPRGSCKSTFAKAFIMWLALEHADRHKYLLYLGAVSGATDDAKEFFLENLRENEILAEDYPEICVPVDFYGDNPQKRVTYHGRTVGFSWSGDSIVLPTIDGSEASGVKIQFLSISSKIRGKAINIGGVPYRPSAVMIDDPQSDQSATSPTQINQMARTIKKAVADLSGFDVQTGKRVTITVVAILTPIAVGDLAEILLSRKISPEYTGVIIPRLPSMPHRMDLWKKYKTIRAESQDTHGDGRLATAFYREHRVEMDDGAVSIDPTDYEPRQISAIQFAMDKWCEDEEAFYCEQQGDAQSASVAVDAAMVPAIIVGKDSLNTPLTVPSWADFMTAFVDIGDHYLNFEVVAYGTNYSAAHTVDFGWFPDQGSGKISKRKYIFDLQEMYSGTTTRERIKEALYELFEFIWCNRYVNERGELIDVSKPSCMAHEKRGFTYPFLAAIGADAGGLNEEAVWTACDEFNRGRADICVPCYGGDARGKLMRFYPLRYDVGEWSRGRMGHHRDWLENPSRAYDHRVRYVSAKRSLLFDTNIFKTRRFYAWSLPVKQSGSHSINHFSPEFMDTYANHQCSEDFMTTRMYDGTHYDRWVPKTVTIGGKKRRMSDNEFLDTNTGCWALADYVGAEYELELRKG